MSNDQAVPLPPDAAPDSQTWEQVLTAAFRAQRDFRAERLGNPEWDWDWDDEAAAIVEAVWPLIAKFERAQGAATERERIVAAIAAEGKRLVDAAMLRMAGDQADDDAMVTQVLRGSTIGNLARRLPDLLDGTP